MSPSALKFEFSYCGTAWLQDICTLKFKTASSPKCLCQFTLSPAMHQGFHFFTSLPALNIMQLYNFCQSNECKVSLYSFLQVCISLVIRKIKHISIYLPVGRVSFFGYCLFTGFSQFSMGVSIFLADMPHISPLLLLETANIFPLISFLLMSHSILH